MGMFDHFHYQGKEFQTKDTPNQALDDYKLEKDQDSGHDYLWVEEYDSEWVDDADAFFGGYFNKKNPRWVRCDNFDGLITFYRNTDKTYKNWEQYDALFMDGKLIKLTDKSYDEPSN